MYKSIVNKSIPLALGIVLGSSVCVNAMARPASAAEDIDQIVVIVNDDVITQKELETQLRETRKQLALQKIKIPSDDLLRKQVLERAILERAQLQIAEMAGIQASEDEIDKALSSIAQRNRMNPKTLLKTLSKEGIELKQYRKQLAKQIRIQKLVDAQVHKRISVSDSEIDEFLQQRKQFMGEDDAYDVSHIMIPVPESATSDAIAKAEAQARKIHDILRQGDDFQQTAIAYSQGRNALEGGNLGWKSAGQLPELFVTALQSMSKGGISEVLRSANGFHIIKLNAKRTTKASKTVTQTHARHILLRPNEIRSEAQARKKLLELKERIEQGDDFAALAKAHSEDPVSAAAGGALGWYNPGQMVPAFEQAAKQLKPGELSDPVQSPFGLHLIQVLERRQQDIGEELDRDEARRQIHARKADERYQQWMRQLRDEAYVQFMSEDTP